MKNFKWLVRREFWENRAIWIVPLAVGAALTLATLFGRINIDGITDANSPASPEQGLVVGGAVLFMFGIVFYLVTYAYSSWYLLDCLYADRKDRSILFWKSLPVSDTETVLAKLFIGLIAIPVVYFLAADIATFLMAIVVSLRLRPFLGDALWHPDQWLQLQALWIYLIVTMAIWYLPFAGWLMVVSAWAKRAAILWSVLPVLAACLFERWFLGTHVFGSVLYDWSAGYPSHAFREPDHASWLTAVIGHANMMRPASVWDLLNPGYFFASPATWISLLVGCALVVVAIQLRLRRAEA